jgi:hypothetical protein
MSHFISAILVISFALVAGSVLGGHGSVLLSVVAQLLAGF